MHEVSIAHGNNKGEARERSRHKNNSNKHERKERVGTIRGKSFKQDLTNAEVFTLVRQKKVFQFRHTRIFYEYLPFLGYQRYKAYPIEIRHV